VQWREKERSTMKNLVLTVALFLGAGALVSAQGQNADQKTAAVKPAGSASQTVLDSWNEIGRKLIAIAEDFPEDKYDFKPVPAQRTFAEQLLHASGVNYYFTNVVLGEKPPASENPPRDQFKSKAAIVEYVKKSFADGAAAVQSIGDSGRGGEELGARRPNSSNAPANVKREARRTVPVLASQSAAVRGIANSNHEDRI
jgi:hypothetical protein